MVKKMAEAQTVKEAILSTKLDNLTDQVSKIDLKLDLQNKHFDSKFEEINKSYVTQKQFADLKHELEIFKKSVKTNYLVISLLSIFFTALITSLIYSFFKVRP